MSQDEQATPTPRTDSTIGADKFVPAWKVRKDMGQLERELSAARAEAERLREALVKLKDAYITARSGQEMTDEEISLAATVNHALAATRKEEGNG